MAVPKAKVSRMRGRKRRTHWTVKFRGMSACPHCGEMRYSYSVCPWCGYYKEKKFVQSYEEKLSERAKKREERMKQTE